MIEKFSYWNLLIQLPVYIAQKDIPNGLHWDQQTKGIVFFFWAIIQNLTPLFFGGIVDKGNKKKYFLLSSVIISLSYILLATQREFLPYIAGIVLLGLGSGIFKTAILGSLSSKMKKSNSSLGWGIYFFLMNLAVFAAPTISKLLKDYSFQYVFWTSFLIYLFNFIIIFIVDNNKLSGTNPSESPQINFKTIIKTLFIPRIGFLVLLFSGFTIIYIQFYETLPNFIMDWSDTSNIVKGLNLPPFMQMNTNRGFMISYEWLYNLNTLVVILFVVMFSYMLKRYNKLSVITSGLALSAIGLFFCGFSAMGWFLILGIIVYTFGEIIINPKMNDYLSSIAPEYLKATYLSFQSIAVTIGFSIGALSSGYLYKHYAEKSYLAIQYLNELGIRNNSATSSFDELTRVLKLSPTQATDLLWNKYHPQIIWIPYLAIALISIIGLIVYARKYKTGTN